MPGTSRAQSKEQSPSVAATPPASAHKQAPAWGSRFVNQPPGNALIALNDIIQYYVETIFTSRESRLENWKVLKFFWGLHPACELEFGYHYVKVRLAELLVDGCGRMVNGESDGRRRKKKADYTGFPRLDEWTQEKWLDFLDDLETIICLIRRKDASLELTCKDDSSKENDKDANNPRIVRLQDKWNKVCDQIHLFAALAPVRKLLEEVAEETQSVIDQELFKDFVHYVENLDEYPDVQNHCRVFYEINNEEPGVFQIAPSEVIKKHICDDENFDLQMFQDDLEELVHQLNVAAFGTQKPELVKLGYKPKVHASSANISGRRDATGVARGVGEEGAAEELATQVVDENNNDVNMIQENQKPAARSGVQTLRKNRQALKETVCDPLESCRNEAARAADVSSRTGVRVSSVSASPHATRPTQRSFASSDKSDDDEETRNSIHLSDLNLPRKRRRLNTQKLYETAHPPDQGLFDENGRATARRKWKDEEKSAVKMGVQRWGIGKWAKIKEEYSEILRNRTSVQVKDCWRTMVQQGEVDPQHIGGT